ncbi:mediator-rna polymerase ii transcription subunit 21 [Trichoderma cornu-damae]|uniref:Mediator of RNA polymerase II transcription subunit 21 n=1 Tax=Trichoderma cornu-damae TaxID=654480 RepID=A0A9P8TW94_9HYPO|nr:mediator-rna polymerase ii transcription subunit 21 [Trichoderma cornu-damae]
MGDRLTQLQDAVDQFAQQLVACMHFVHMRHDLETLGPKDKIREPKEQVPREVDALPPQDFRAGLVELSRDLIVKEQQIEVLISTLPGLDNSERDQERHIKDLEEDLKTAEAQRVEALREKEHILTELDAIIRNIRRP